MDGITRRVFYGWWIVVLGSIITAVGMGIVNHSFTVFFLPLKRDLMLSSAAVSLLFGAARLEGGVEGPIVGPLIDRFGPRIVIIGGVALAGIGFILLSTVHSFLALFLIYVFVVAFGYSAGFYHPVYTAVNSWFIRRRTTGFAIVTAAGGFGGVVMPPLLAHLIVSFGWRFAALIAGFIILVIALPAALPIHRSPEIRGLYPDGGLQQGNDTDGPSTANPAARAMDYTVKEALRTRTYWLLASSITLRISATIALTAHLIPILVWKGIGETTAAYLVSLFASISIITTLAMGWMGDRWNKPLLCVIGIIATVLGMLGLVVSQAPIAIYAFPITLGITLGTTVLNWSLIGDLFGRSSYATLRGIMAPGYGMASFFSPIFAGWVFDKTGSYVIALTTFSTVLLLAASLFVMLRCSLPLDKRSYIPTAR